jgi:hypothetical protein
MRKYPSQIIGLTTISSITLLIPEAAVADMSLIAFELEEDQLCPKRSSYQLLFSKQLILFEICRQLTSRVTFLAVENVFFVFPFFHYCHRLKEFFTIVKNIQQCLSARTNVRHTNQPTCPGIPGIHQKLYPVSSQDRDSTHVHTFFTHPVFHRPQLIGDYDTNLTRRRQAPDTEELLLSVCDEFRESSCR